MRLFDSHAHYYDERFNDYPDGAEGALRDSFDSGICGILCAGTSPETSGAAISLAERYPQIWASAGLHPLDSADIPYGDEIRTLDEVRARLSHPRVCAIGEIGLDYHYGGEDKARQKMFFDAQLSMSEELSLPVIVHDREAHGDTYDIIRAHPRAVGVLHSFSGSAESAAQLVRMGWYISFSGPVTYKNADNLRRAVLAVPDDRILTETDAPYLPPVPHRGRINLSAYLCHTAAVLAEVRDADPDVFCAQTVENTTRLFGITLRNDSGR